MGRSTELARELRDVREEKATVKAREKELNARERELNEELVQIMAEEGLQNFKQDGYIHYLSTRVFASASSGRMPELIEWMRENGLDELVTTTVNSQKLSSFVKDQTEEVDELPDGLDELVNVHEEIKVNIRKG